MNKFTVKLAALILILFFINTTPAFSIDTSPEALEKGLSSCRTYDDYEKYVKGLKALAKNERAKDLDLLCYFIAKAKIEELGMLSAKDDIESVRLYMQLASGYYEEAAEYLDKALLVTKSGPLKLDIFFLKIIIVKANLQAARSDALLDDMAGKIASFSKSAEENKSQLYRMAGEFEKQGMPEYGLKLKVLFAQKANRGTALEIAEEMKSEADSLFDKGDFKKANEIYRYYFESIEKIQNKEERAKKIIEVADKYFKNKRYIDAMKFYEDYAVNYSDYGMADYCSYRAGECMYLGQNFSESMMQFYTFLNTYPESKWFSDGFEYLARLYYGIPSIDVAIEKLETLSARYSEKEIRQYALLLAGILYYIKKDYDSALGKLKEIERSYPQSEYHYPTECLIKDLEEVKKGNQPTYYSPEEETYKMWMPFPPVMADLKSEMPEGIRLALTFTTEAFADESRASKEAKMLAVTGDVKVLKKGEGKWVAAEEGAVLRSGDRIKTGRLSLCDIAFDDKTQNVIGVYPDSDLVVLLNNNEKLEIIEADIMARILSVPQGSSFEVKTPNAVCGIRGTGFGIKGKKELTKASAYENSIFVKNTSGNIEESVEEGFTRVVDKEGNISDATETDPEEVSEFQSWPVYITVKPGAAVKFTLTKIQDFDRCEEFLYDAGDRSRLPKKMGDKTEKDLVGLRWTTSENGKFKNGKQSKEKIWQAPKKPGTYRVTLRADDLALMRLPDTGTRKDKTKEVNAVIIVKE